MSTVLVVIAIDVGKAKGGSHYWGCTQIKMGGAYT